MTASCLTGGPDRGVAGGPKTVWLVLIGAVGTQAYVFATNRLRDAVAGHF
jgi:hypothetical protein